MGSEQPITEPSETWSTLVEMLRARAQECPERVVCTFIADSDEAETHLTYGQLDVRARAIADRLLKRGGPFEPILLLYPPGLDYIAGLFGCLYAGALAVPAYPPLNERQAVRLQKIAKDAGARLVLSTSAIIARFKQLTAKEGKGEGAGLAESFSWTATDDLDLSGAKRWKDPGVSAEDLAFLQYTSGSTSAPKGVMLTHRNLMHNLRTIGRLFKLRPGSASVSWLPPYHDMGLIGQILEPIYHGVHTYLMSPASFLQSPVRWLQTIARTESEVSGGPNFAYELCARRAQPSDLEGLDLSRWRVAFNGAEPIRAETLDLFAEKFAPCGFRREAFYPCYGMAEGTLLLSGGDHEAPPIVSSYDSEQLRNRKAVKGGELARRLVSSGRVAREHRLQITDPETLLQVQDGQIGEIWVAGPSVAGGYWRQRELTKQTFLATSPGEDQVPFLRTGDLGFLQEGELFVVGRLKDLIILRGRNLHPEDIELTVSRCHPDVRPSCGAAFATELAGEERLVVVQEVARKLSGTRDEILRAIRRSVAEEHGAEVHAVALLQVGSIPKTSSGKIQRHACREGFVSGSLREVFRWTQAEKGGDSDGAATDAATPRAAASRAPLGTESSEKLRVATWLAAWIAKKGGVTVDQISPDEPLAAFGLASVDVVKLSTDLEQWLGRRLSPVLAYQYPTISALAEYLAGDARSVDEASQRRPTDELEPIAIVGMACRFPGAADPEAFWQLLETGGDAVSVRPERWANVGLTGAELTRVANVPAGFLEQVDAFDAEFFGVAPREAAHMDPQQRLLLEVTTEALERAGCGGRASQRRTGVFVGVSSNDYAQLMVRAGADLNAYSGTGTASSIVANRLSYQLDFRGPSVAVDTACSSSLVAVHLAVASLRRGECDAALAGGVNLLLSPDPTIVFSHAQMMAGGGRCRTFDASADGYVRGEGCGVVVLKRLSDALAQRDHIIAVIRGSAVNQDGRSNGLTAPNGLSQQAVVRAALANAGLAAGDIDYVEAHGTGTPLGDPIEVDALKSVLSEHGPRPRSCGVGSAKTNIGHLEAAAGIAGLIKTILALDRGTIPPHLHLKELNPKISLDDVLFVPQEPTAWPSTGAPRRAGVSSFGFGGTNCHIVVEQAPLRASAGERIERPVNVLALSARSERALAALARKFVEAAQDESVAVADLCFTANSGRAHHAHRLAISAADRSALVGALEAFDVSSRDNLIVGRLAGGRAPSVAFLFTGQGSQYPGMGRELFESEPRFREEMDRCESLLRPHLAEPLLSVIYGANAGLLDQTAYTQPALFALEWSLTQLWRSWGVEPRAVIGHSVGELVAACVAGVMELEDALRLVAARGRLMQALPGEGGMAALRCDESVARRVLQEVGGRVAVAAVNSREEVVVSGPTEQVRGFCDVIARLGVQSRSLNVSHAFHSALMEPMLAELEAVASTIAFSSPRLELISNLTGRPAGDEVCTPAYWKQHVRESVRFADGLKALRTEGYNLFIEVGPAPVLSAFGRHDAVPGETFVPSLSRGKADWPLLAQALGSLYVAGANIDWAAFDGERKRSRVVLPTYPFERERFWFKPGGARQRPQQGHPLLGGALVLPGSREQRFEGSIQSHSAPSLQDHQVFGEVVLPAAALVEMALSAAQVATNCTALRLENVVFCRAVLLSRGEGETVQTVVGAEDAAGTRSVEVYSRAATATDAATEAEWSLTMTASVVAKADGTAVALDIERLRAEYAREVSTGELYARFRARGLEYGPAFRALNEVRCGGRRALGRIELPAPADIAGFRMNPVVLDAALHVIGVLFIDEARSDAWLPVALESLDCFDGSDAVVWSHVELRDAGTATERVADVTLLRADGTTATELRGLRLRPVPRQALVGAASPIDDWFYRLDWRRRSRRGLSSVAEFIPVPESIGDACADELSQIASAHGSALDSYPMSSLLLEGLAFDFAARALMQLGWQPRAGETFTVDNLVDSLAVIPKYRRLLHRLLEMLCEERVLSADGGLFQVLDVQRLTTMDDPAKRLESCRELLPHARCELDLLARTAVPLADVLRGQVDALTLLFPNGDMSVLTTIYQDTAGAQVLNRTAAAAMARAIQNLPPSRTLRVLEIGAGTGATAAHLLPRLPADQTEYVFTDVSPLFTTNAKRRFSEYGFLTFGTLDIERDPAQQGFVNHSFDLVVASNVLHATRDVVASVRHARQLLAPGGLLLLSEVTKRVRWLDLIFGLAEGWWRFADPDLRRTYPLLEESQWARLLQSEGFQQVANVAGRHSKQASLAPTAVFLAQADMSQAPVASASQGGTWLIVAQTPPSNAQTDTARELARLLRVKGRSVMCRTHDGSLNEGVREALESLQGGAGLEGVVCLCGSDSEPGALNDSGSRVPAATLWALRVAKLLAESHLSPNPKLWLVTEGAAAVGRGVDALGLWQTPVWGLGRTVQLEHPELSCKLVDLDRDNAQSLWLLADELITADSDTQIAYRGDERFVARLARAFGSGSSASGSRLSVPRDLAPGAGFRLAIETRGALSDLHLASVPRVPPGPGAVEIEVRATGLNFRDVLNAMGLYPGDAGPLGCDTCGVVVGVGEGVERFKVGDEVIAIAAGTFGSYVTVNAALVAHKPRNLSFEEAATIPVAFVTAHCALFGASITAGSRVLIHSGAGGVGQAAIQLAKRAGAEVFATASQSKWQTLETLGVDHISSSRSLQFADDIAKITGGRGVDIVVNSFTGEYIAKGLASLAPAGRFVEIGKNDVWSPERARDVCATAEYSVFDLPVLCERDPAKVQAVLEELVKAFEAGTLLPIPHRLFPLSDAVEAFRVMQRTEHVGKLVISMAKVDSQERAVAAPRIVAEATYFISGGLGDLGLLTARWLIERGARHLLLMSRREVVGAMRARLEELESLGGRLQVVRGDVANWQHVSDAISSIDPALPLRGIVHAAGVLDDALLLRQDEAHFQKVLAPKVWGAWHLHQVSQGQPLDFFLLFASVAGLLGSKGQANHAAANTFLDGLAHHRRSLGLPATSIDWGIWSELGEAARKGADTQSRFKAMGHIPPARGIEAFERVFNATLGAAAAQVAVVPIDWQQLASQAEETPLLDDFRSTSTEATVAVDAELLRRLQESTADERRAILEERLSAQVAHVLGWGPERVVDPKLGFFDTGMDSLTSLELRNLIQRSFGCALPSTVAFDYPTIEALAGYLLREIPGLDDGATAAASTGAQREPRREEALEPVPQLSSNEVRDLLDQQLMSVEALLDSAQDEVGL